jgi:hypothetical protein
MKLLRSALILTCALASTACGMDMFKNIFKSPTEPSSSSDVRSYLGTWTSTATAAPVGQTCSGLLWKITAQTGGQASGDFSATCGDGVTLAGTMTATHGDTSIPWAATGTATKGSAACPFSMTGTGTFQGTSNILVSYAGTSCNGPVSGSETIKR